MSLLPASIPRATVAGQFREEPLGFLAQARAACGDIFVLRDGGPVFSRSADCSGAVAVFGAAGQRAVLTDIELFGMPVSAAQHLALPRKLVNLNRGLHSMRGEQHARHQRLLMRVLSERGIEAQHGAVSAGLEAFARGWRYGQNIELLGEMRRLALQVSERLLFGTQYAESAELALLLQTYFQLRREAASPLNPAGETLRAELVALGTALDEALRRHVRWSRRQPADSSAGILTTLAGLAFDSGGRPAADELVAHGNVLFMSSNEPVAVSLTWILLILSQLPNLRRALRRELAQSAPADAAPSAARLARLTLLDAVVNESLRLLTPNALMARVTTRPATLDGVRLPERCEVVLCPFLAHRDAERFPRPSEFLPSRWHGARPSPFEYFPFGAGGHACVGRQLGIYLIKAALAVLIPRYELVLAADQEIDWRIHIMLMPRNEPLMSVRAPGASAISGGRLRGPVGELIKLDACES